ncbi:MAG: hypothetical protein H6P98_483 [Candidatus Aminicenantes bacterium]|nr:hypothetical protein [Candidatus Aminicenantes bacterium]
MDCFSYWLDVGDSFKKLRPIPIVGGKLEYFIYRGSNLNAALYFSHLYLCVNSFNE